MKTTKSVQTNNTIVNLNGVLSYIKDGKRHVIRNNKKITKLGDVRNYSDNN